MDEIIIKISFILSLLFMIFGYFSQMSYETFLLRGLVVFLVSAFALNMVHIVIVKKFISAKIDVLQDDFVHTYNLVKAKREERVKEIGNENSKEEEEA